MAQALVPAAGGRAARSTLQRFDSIDAACEERRSDAEEEKRQCRRAQGKTKHPPIDRKYEIRAAAVGNDGMQPVRGPHGNDERSSAAGHRQDDRFERERADELEPGSSQGATHGELPSAFNGSREKEIRKMRTSDQQHESG